jgi:adenosylcobinamide-GDP ribazoletransferase
VRSLLFPLASYAADMTACLRFYSRIPCPALPFEQAAHAMPDFTRAPRALPLAALLIALPACATLGLASALGLSAPLTALLALAAGALTTGCFHEDGLADVADGFGGGAGVERKLEIMKDSRVGTYGATAVALSFGLRGAAIAAILAQHGTGAACAAFAASAVFARICGLGPLWALPPARKDGAAFAAARPTNAAMASAALLAGLIAFILALWGGLSLLALSAALALGIAGGAVVTGIAARQIGGQTGDVAGAAEQIAEIAMLAAFSSTSFQ